MRSLFLGFFLALFSFGTSQNYDVSFIPDSIKADADIVYRNSIINFEVENERKAKMSVIESKTILNKDGEDKAYFVLSYDECRKIKKLSAQLLDAKGEIIKKYKEKDFLDLASGGGLVNDTRLKVIDFHRSIFPYTISVMYEIQYDGVVSYPHWEPVLSYGCGVEHVEFNLSHPVEMPVQIKQLNYDKKPEVRILDGVKTLKWEEHCLKSVRTEPFSPPAIEVFPSVWTAPVKFEYDGIAGSMESWKTFGQWSWELNKDRDILPPETVEEIRQMSDSIIDLRLKVKRLYEFMQSKTRYVNVSLGIGGWQPLPAMKVDETGYGDCKALSNYMRSILKVVDIESYYTLIGSGGQKVRFDDFASMGQANHVILCVPDNSDTIWLECTSQTIPFGYIGRSNSKRKALLVTQEGGQIVNTPEYSTEKSMQVRHALVKLGLSGDAKAEINTCYSGIQFDNRRYVLSQNYEDQKKWLLTNMDFASADILGFDFSTPVMKDGLPYLDEKLEVNLRKFSSKTGQRVFFPVMFMDGFEGAPRNLEERKNDIFKEYGYLDIDSIRYELPKGYVVEFKPENDTVRSVFGEYRLTFTECEDQLLVNRRLLMKDGRWPADTYKDMQEFYKKIREIDNSKVVLVQNQ